MVGRRRAILGTVRSELGLVRESTTSTVDRGKSRVRPMQRLPTRTPSQFGLASSKWRTSSRTFSKLHTPPARVGGTFNTMNLKPELVAFAAILFVAVGCEPKADPMPVSGPKPPESSFVDEMVAKAQGDPSKLTPEERAKMDKITRGNTDIVIKTSKK